MSISIGHITLKEEKDVVLARQWTKEIASLSKGGSGQMAATTPADTAGRSQTAQPLNLAALKSRMGEVSAKKLLGLFKARAPSDLERLRLSVQNKDLREFVHTTHLFQGLFSAIYADHLRALATNIEETAMQGDWKQTSNLLEQFEQSLAELMLFIDSN